jgi:hypothetical protein
MKNMDVIVQSRNRCNIPGGEVRVGRSVKGLGK